jgi:hypothetical protein
VISFFDPDGLIAGVGLGDAPADMEAMAGAVEKLLSSEADHSLVAERCRRYALENYAPAAIARRYIELGAMGDAFSAP